MTTVHVQLPVAPQVLPPVSRQKLPTQQGLALEQVWPLLAQVAAWQVPVAEPLGLLHARPVQQSAEAVHTWLCGEHSWAGWQTFGPPSVEVQIPAQHSAEAAQVVPFDLHTPASGTAPPSTGTPASGMGRRHARPELEAPHEVPAQQVVAAPPSPAAQLAPSGRHTGTTAHVSPAPPSALGRHGEPPQHWSLNWHAWPAAMQHGAMPV